MFWLCFCHLKAGWSQYMFLKSRHKGVAGSSNSALSSELWPAAVSPMLIFIRFPPHCIGCTNVSAWHGEERTCCLEGELSAAEGVTTWTTKWGTRLGFISDYWKAGLPLSMLMIWLVTRHEKDSQNAAFLLCNHLKLRLTPPFVPL